MLDFELAEIYGYTTKAFNQQVKNNIAKFDEDFRFQPTREELEELVRSKNLTSREDSFLRDNQEVHAICPGVLLNLDYSRTGIIQTE